MRSAGVVDQLNHHPVSPSAQTPLLARRGYGRFVLLICSSGVLPAAACSSTAMP